MAPSSAHGQAWPPVSPVTMVDFPSLILLAFATELMVGGPLRDGMNRVPLYLVMGTYSKEGMNAALEEGFASREDALRPVVEAMGGTLESVHFCSPAAGFDFVFQMTAPNADVAYAMSVMGSANSAIAGGGQVFELKTGAEADALLAKAAESMATYRAPGEASD